MSSGGHWDSSLYDDRHSFVWKLGSDLIEWLNPQAGESVLDLGCGTGHLTAGIAKRGAIVTGLDASPEMIGLARQNYPELTFRLEDARDFRVEEPFDAVFSNAVLHWIHEADRVVACVAAALKPGGRFVAEFGGKGNVKRLLDGTLTVLARHGMEAANPWYYPSIGEYTAVLEAGGLEVVQAHLFDRMTELEDPERGMRHWLEMFGKKLIGTASDAILREIEDELRPHLFFDGRWHADYRRLRVIARRL